MPLLVFPIDVEKARDRLTASFAITTVAFCDFWIGLSKAPCGWEIQTVPESI